MRMTPTAYTAFAWELERCGARCGRYVMRRVDLTALTVIAVKDGLDGALAPELGGAGPEPPASLGTGRPGLPGDRRTDVEARAQSSAITAIVYLNGDDERPADCAVAQRGSRRPDNTLSGRSLIIARRFRGTEALRDRPDMLPSAELSGSTKDGGLTASASRGARSLHAKTWAFVHF